MDFFAVLHRIIIIIITIDNGGNAELLRAKNITFVSKEYLLYGIDFEINLQSWSTAERR